MLPSADNLTGRNEIEGVYIYSILHDLSFIKQLCYL